MLDLDIEVNGEPRRVRGGATVMDLLVSLGLGDTLVAVERNAAVVPRAEHPHTKLEAGDQVEIVHFVGGG